MKHFNLLLSAVVVVLALQIFNVMAELEVGDESLTIETLFHVIDTESNMDHGGVGLKTLLPGSFKRKLPEIDRGAALQVVVQMIEKQKALNRHTDNMKSQVEIISENETKETIDIK